MLLFVLVMFVSREPVDPPRNWMPLPLNPLIMRALPLLAVEKTTALTPAPITRPLVPAVVPVPSSVIAPFTATLLAFVSVIPCSGVALPTAPANVIAMPEESVGLRAPSTVDEKPMFPPEVSATSDSSVTAPAYACDPVGVLTPADTRIP